MSWVIGFDSNWNRDIGYGVLAFCDHPGCKKRDRPRPVVRLRRGALRRG